MAKTNINLTVFIVVVDKPSAPQDLSVTDIMVDSCIMHWQPPKDNGGCEIKQYVVEKREANRRSWNKVDTTATLELTITKLTKNIQYVFRVAAENDVGVGEFAELPEPVTAKETFSKYCCFIVLKKLKEQLIHQMTFP
jgi:titin